VNQQKLRWMGYDLLGYLIIVILMDTFLGCDIHAFVALSVWAVWQGMKLAFCKDATHYTQWSIFNCGPKV